MKILSILIVITLLILDAHARLPVGMYELRFKEAISLVGAVKQFNSKLGPELEKLHAAPITEQEIRNALAIGNGFYCRPLKSEVADLCMDCWENGSLPAGSTLVIYTQEGIGPPKHNKDEKFLFIYLVLTTLPYVENPPEVVPDDEMLKASQIFPVRLLPAPSEKKEKDQK